MPPSKRQSQGSSAPAKKGKTTPGPASPQNLADHPTVQMLEQALQCLCHELKSVSGSEASPIGGVPAFDADMYKLCFKKYDEFDASVPLTSFCLRDWTHPGIPPSVGAFG